MWTKAEFFKVLSRHPDGGTFWTKTKRCVRYLRVHSDGDTVVTVMTQHCGFRGRKESSVSLYVRDSRGSRVNHFNDPAKTEAFTNRLLNATALLWVRARLRVTAREFVSHPPRTKFLPIW